MRGKIRNLLNHLERGGSKKCVYRLALPVFVVLLTTVLVRASSLDELFDYRGISAINVSPDGSRAVFVVSATSLEENMANSDLWLVEFSSGRSIQLTKSTRTDNFPVWSADGRKIAFSSNREGSNQIWLISPDGGEAEPATKLARFNVRQFLWLPDGSGFVFLAPEPLPQRAPAQMQMELRGRGQQNEPILVDKNVQHFDLRRRIWMRLYKVKLGEQNAERLTKEDYHVTSFDVSPDGEEVVFSSQPAPGRPNANLSDLKILDLSSGVVRDLVTRPGSDSDPRFSPKGKWIAFISQNGENGNRILQVVSPDGSGQRSLSESFDENIMDFQWTANEDQILFLAHQGVSSRVFRLQVSSGKFEALKALNGLQVCHSFSFNNDGRVGAAVISDANTPSEVYLLQDSGESKRKLTQINSEFAGLAPKTELLKYRSKDKLDLEALVIKPKDFQEGRRYPLLVIIHGGPAGIFDYGFYPRRGAYPIFIFADQGYVLFLPNPRGSTGYGMKFRKANFQDLGGADFGDIMAGVDLLIEKGVADPERMGLMGWSYGGFMAYWVETHTDRFKAISAGAGLTDLLSFYGTNDAEGEGLELHFGMPPWKNPKMYMDHSAMTFILKAKTPLLIQHGQQDVRVPLSQAQEFFFAAKKLGLAVEMVVYPGQEHSIEEPKLALDSMERNLNWFNKWVRGVESLKK